MSEQVEPFTREFYSKQIDFVLEEIRNDKEKLLDIIMDKCSHITVSIPFNIGEVPHYEVDYVKTCIVIERLETKECKKN
jgi:hypothetical protein